MNFVANETNLACDGARIRRSWDSGNPELSRKLRTPDLCGQGIRPSLAVPSPLLLPATRSLSIRYRVAGRRSGAGTEVDTDVSTAPAKHASHKLGPGSHLRTGPRISRAPSGAAAYLVIFETTPEPTVRPPSRIAKRRPSSMAIGAISLTPMVTLSPGITISVPSGRITSPVTSVVRK